MSRLRSDLRRILPLGLAALLGGCGGGDGLPRQEVLGQVTLNGEPLADGTIQFQPGTITEGPEVSGGALISGGVYRIARNEGLVPGTYKVLIFAHDEAKTPAATASDPGARGGPPAELIPPRYNASTTLTAEISKEKPNVFNFDLKK
jgi:hypothetical protein